jgi:putative transcriptional regulator
MGSGPGPHLAVQHHSGSCVIAYYAILRITPNVKMIRCHLSTLMGRDKLRVADVSRRTGLNRSTITALYNETTTRVDLPAIEQLCRLFNCQVGDLFEYINDGGEVNA